MTTSQPVTSRDLSLQFYDLFAAKQKKKKVDTDLKKGPPTLAAPTGALRVLQPSIDASDKLCKVCSDAVLHSKRRIGDALDLVDDCADDSSDANGSLLLAEAELLSASMAVTNFQQSLKSVAEKTLKSSGSAGAGGGGGLAQVLGLVEQIGGGEKRKVSQTDLYKHLEEMLVILESRVAQERLRAALCREELELFESQMSLFGSGWVTHVSSRSGHTDPRAVKDSGAKPLLPLPAVPGGGSSATHILNAARKTEQLLKSTVSSATGSVLDIIRATTTAAAETASSSTSPLLPSFLQSVSRGDSSSNGGGKVSSAQTAARRQSTHQEPQELHLTGDEVARFEERNELMLVQQRQRSSNDAKLVETSVRELSQLTSLMSEMVLQQSEQVGILARNTEDAQVNVLGATRELKKPLSRFWTPTKQLIFLLWVSTFVVLLAHFLFR